MAEKLLQLAMYVKTILIIIWKLFKIYDMILITIFNFFQTFFKD